MGLKFDPLNHHDYWLLDTFCECEVCVEWRGKYELFKKAQELVGQKRFEQQHRAEWQSAMWQYIAASNRRDLYCEISFHAANTYAVSGVQMMAWITEQIRDPGKTDGWWTMREVNLPIHYWILLFLRYVREEAVARPPLVMYAAPRLAVS